MQICNFLQTTQAFSLKLNDPPLKLSSRRSWVEKTKNDAEILTGMVVLKWQLDDLSIPSLGYPWLRQTLSENHAPHCASPKCKKNATTAIVIDNNCRPMGALEFRLLHKNRKSKVHYNSSFLIKLRIIIPPMLEHGCAATLQKSSERSRVSAVFRDSQQSEDFAMSSLILPWVSWQTCKFCKKTATSDNQMSGLSDIFSNPRRRLVQELAHILSSQPIEGCSRS